MPEPLSISEDPEGVRNDADLADYEAYSEQQEEAILRLRRIGLLKKGRTFRLDPTNPEHKLSDHRLRICRSLRSWKIFLVVSTILS
jgi:hypothetical protein